MPKIAFILLSLALAPAPGTGPAMDLPTKVPPKGVDVTVQKQLSPLLTSKQLAGIASKFVKTTEPALDQVIDVGVQRMRNGEVVLSLVCPDFVTGQYEGSAGWAKPVAPNCQATIYGAIVEFPVVAGRVYVVNCSTNGGAWRIARWDAGKMVGAEEHSRASSPSIVIAATQTKRESVAFAIDWTVDGAGFSFSMGKCQVGRLAV